MIGKVLGGRYRITQQIDSGGMAYIYKAECKKTNTIVALKILKDKFSGSSEYVDRFKREAQAAFVLDNEHIVHVRRHRFMTRTSTTWSWSTLTARRLKI